MFSESLKVVKDTVSQKAGGPSYPYTHKLHIRTDRCPTTAAPNATLRYMSQVECVNSSEFIAGSVREYSE